MAPWTHIDWAALAKSRRKPNRDPPDNVKPATLAWYEWYLVHDQFPGGAWFLQTGLKLTHLPFTRLDEDAAKAVEKEIKVINVAQNKSSLQPLRFIRYPKLVDELFQQWRPKIDATVPDWFLESGLKTRLMQHTRNRRARIKKKQKCEGRALSEHFHSTPVRRPRTRQLDPRHSPPTYDDDNPGLATPPITHFKIKSSKRRAIASVDIVDDNYEDIILPEAPSELDISSFGPGQIQVNGEANTASRSRSPAETSTIEVTTEDVVEDNMLADDNESISTSSESYTSEEEVMPSKLQSILALHPPTRQPPSKSTILKNKTSSPTLSHHPSSSPISHAEAISRTPSPTPSVDDPAPSWSCLCGHPNPPAEKRTSNYMCMDHERWIPRNQMTVYANREKAGRKVRLAWTAPKLRACVCGYPDEPEEPCMKNWMCGEHRRWVPRNRLAIVEDWV